MPKKRGFFDERDAIDILREAFLGTPKQVKRIRKPRVQAASILSSFMSLAGKESAPVEAPASSSPSSGEPDMALVMQSNEARLAELHRLQAAGTLSPQEERELHARTAAHVSQCDMAEIEKVLDTSRHLGTEIPQGYDGAADIIKLEIAKLKAGSMPILPTPPRVGAERQVAIPKPIKPVPKPVPESPPVPKPVEPKIKNPAIPTPAPAPIPETAPSDLPSIESLEEQMKAAEKQTIHEAAPPPVPPTPQPDVAVQPNKPKKAPKLEKKEVALPKPPPIPKIKPLDTLEPTPLTPEETDDLLNGQYPEATVSPEELAQVLERRKTPILEGVGGKIQKKSGNFRVTAKKGDALWNLIEDRLGSSDAMGKDFANKFNALPPGKRIHIIDAVESFVRKSKDVFHITDPDLIRLGDTIDLGPILDDEKSMLELVATAQDKETALDAAITEMDKIIMDKSRANDDKALVELEIDKALFGPVLPAEEKIPPEEDSSDISPPAAAVLPGTEKKKIEIMLYPKENRWRKFLGFSAEEYNSIRNIKIRQLLELIPSREKAEISWSSAVRQELLDVPRAKFESMMRLSEFIRGYSSGNGKGIREMTIRQFFGGISNCQ